MIRLRLSLAALACLAPLSACHLIVNLDDDEGDETIDAPLADAPVDSAEGASCAVELSCPPPTANRMTVCGRLWDLEDEATISASTTNVCAGPSPSGPCAIAVRYYDALDWAQNPDTAQDLIAGSTYLDHCGRFRAIDLNTPTFGFLAIVTEDATGAPDALRRTAITLPAAEARPATELRAYVTRNTTDAAWSAALGLTGMTLGQRGAYVPIFLHGDVPVQGVRVTRDNNQIPADDAYFSDPGVTRSTVDPARTSTGPNGSAIVQSTPAPIQFSGTGGEPAGCEWPQTLAASTPGAILVQRKQAQQPGGGPCP